MLWLARSDPVPANASAAHGLWQLGNCVLGPSAVKHVMGHLGEASPDVRQAAAAATAAALEVNSHALYGLHRSRNCVTPELYGVMHAVWGRLR